MVRMPRRVRARREPTAACGGRWLVRVGASVVAVTAAMAVAASGETAGAALYRIFLTGGDTLVTYGDYARVGDRVVFAMPLGLEAEPPNTQLVSIPATSVDWPTTEQYAESVRYHQYASTRGEDDFTLLSADVARVLNEIATTPDPERRLAIARYARQQLVAWTRRSYGYRGDDIRAFVGLLDEAISGLQTAAGAGAFELSFVATTERPPTVALLPKPTLQELIAQALTVSKITPVAAERVAVLQSVLLALHEGAVAASAEWVAATRTLATRAVEAELAVEGAYADLSTVMVARASAYARRADVRAVAALIGEVLGRDAALGRRRPDQIAALLAAIETRLESARRLKLERDRWTLRVHAYRLYQRSLATPIDEFEATRPALDDIRLLAGPDPQQLGGLQAQLAAALRALDGALPPSDLQSVHGLFTRALQLAASAATLRERAIETGEMRIAWNASAAAAGSILLFERARDELGRAIEGPDLN